MAEKGTSKRTVDLKRVYRILQSHQNVKDVLQAPQKMERFYIVKQQQSLQIEKSSLRSG